MTDNISDPSALGRRSFLGFAALAAAAPILTEADMAQAKMASQGRGVLPEDAVIINANENPLGPCKAAIDAMAAIINQLAQAGAVAQDDLGVAPGAVTIGPFRTPLRSMLESTAGAQGFRAPSHPALETRRPCVSYLWTPSSPVSPLPAPSLYWIPTP